jgi:hypothetical protein
VQREPDDDEKEIGTRERIRCKRGTQGDIRTRKTKCV